MSSPAPSKQGWAEPRSSFEEFLKEFLNASLHRYLLLVRDLKGSHATLVKIVMITTMTMMIMMMFVVVVVVVMMVVVVRLLLLLLMMMMMMMMSW